jgi:uncharacterized protein (DUF1330 family)
MRRTRAKVKARCDAKGENLMKAYVIFDVGIDDPVRYQEYRDLLWRAIEAAGGKYLVCDGPLKVHEGDWKPRNLVILEFPSVAAWETLYNGPTFRGLKQIHDTCSSARIVSVEGLEGVA